MRNVAIQFHTRRDADTGGFEFIHKSFGEYLAARGLLAAGLRAANAMRHDDEPWSEPHVAEHWAKLVAAAELSEEILRFLADEARLLLIGEAEAALSPLTRVFNWTLANGLPVHRIPSEASFRSLETMQRCGESGLVAVLDALQHHARSQPTQGDGQRVLSVEWGRDAHGPILFLHRLRVTLGRPIRLALGCLNLSRADLFSANLHEANLGGADLSRANLIVANLTGADLSGADLREANLSGADLSVAYLFGANLSGADLSVAHLSGANLTGADLSGANLRGANLRDWICREASLRFADLQAVMHLSPASIESAFGVRSGIGRTLLPDGTDPPEHWHVAADAEEDSEEARRDYAAALAAWRMSSARAH